MNGDKIGQLALRYRLPAASLQGSVLKGGGVVATTPDFEKIWMTGAMIVDKIAGGSGRRIYQSINRSLSGCSLI